MAIVYDRDIEVTMVGIVEDDTLACTVNSLEIRNGQARLELRTGIKGVPGVQGDPSWPFVFMGPVADQPTLDAIAATLTAADFGKAWWVQSTNELRYYARRYWIRFENIFQAQGHPGPPNVLTGAAVTGATGSSASAAFTGSPPNQILTITVPKGAAGVTGDPGVAGRIQDAADVDLTTAALGSDMVLQWDTTTSKFHAAPTPTWGGPWRIAGNRFATASNTAEAPRTIASITIPSKPHPWRPYITGLLAMASHVQSIGAGRVDLEVRSGAEDGPMVAWGRGFPTANWIWTRILPKFEQVMSPATTSIGVINAGQTATFYVRVIRPLGSSNYSSNPNIANLTVYAMPLHA